MRCSALIIVFLAMAFTTTAFCADLAGCQIPLEKALCYGQPVGHWAQKSGNLITNLKQYQERKCLPVPAHLKQTLISIYLQYPREIQKAFCDIKRIFIVSGDVPYGALADYYFDVSTVKSQPGRLGTKFSGNPTGYVLELSEKNRFKGESAPDYLTRVFQARFGNLKGSDLLPTAEYENPFGENGALATTIVHEIGHMLGRAQKMTSTYFLPLSEGDWSKHAFTLIDGSYELKHALSNFGFLSTNKMLGAEHIEPTFTLFRKSGMASLYAGSSPQEDLAEFYMFSFYGNLKWVIKGEAAFDLSFEMANNPVFRAKKQLIQNLMGLPEPFSLKGRTVSGEIGPM